MTSFDDKTRVTVDKESRNAATELSLIVSLNELVMEKLIRDTRHLLEITDPEVLFDLYTDYLFDWVQGIDVNFKQSRAYGLIMVNAYYLVTFLSLLQA